MVVSSELSYFMLMLPACRAHTLSLLGLFRQQLFHLTSVQLVVSNVSEGVAGITERDPHPPKIESLLLFAQRGCVDAHVSCELIPDQVLSAEFKYAVPSDRTVLQLSSSFLFCGDVDLVLPFYLQTFQSNYFLMFQFKPRAYGGRPLFLSAALRQLSSPWLL